MITLWSIQIVLAQISLQVKALDFDIEFHLQGQITNNNFNIVNGQKPIFNFINLKAISYSMKCPWEIPRALLLMFLMFCIWNFSKVKNVSVTSFKQQQILNDNIVLIHENNNIRPKFQITASNGCFSTSFLGETNI